MKENYTAITVILDRSGSMEKIAKDAIGGFNSFVEDQKRVKGTATLSLHQFDDRFQTDYEFKNISTVEPLNSKTFVPRGWTALYDAIGKTIISTGEKLASMSESARPSKVIVLIITDGKENNSKEFEASSVKRLITKQTDKYNWEFVFIGANQDVIFTATTLGIRAVNTVSFKSTGASVDAMYSNLSKNVASFRLGNSVDYSNKEDK